MDIKIQSNKIKIIISTAALIVAFGAILIVSGFYPIAFVGGRFITWQNLRHSTQVAFHYYKAASQTYGGSSDDLNKPENIQEVNRAILDKLIENKIILKGLESIPEASRIVKNKVDQALKQSTNLKEAVNALYGINVDDFTELILVPQSRKEVLEGRLTLENKNFDDWLKETKKTTKVLILLNDFSWDGEKVVLKK